MVAYDKATAKRGEKYIEDRRGVPTKGGRGIARRIANEVGGYASRTTRRGIKAHQKAISMLTPDGGPKKKASAKGIGALAEKPITLPRKR